VRGSPKRIEVHITLPLFDDLNGIESLVFGQKQDIKITLVCAVERGSFLASEQISPFRRLNAFNYESVVD
jgi:hypothetical protein